MEISLILFSEGCHLLPLRHLFPGTGHFSLKRWCWTPPPLGVRLQETFSPDFVVPIAPKFTQVRVCALTKSSSLSSWSQSYIWWEIIKQKFGEFLRATYSTQNNPRGGAHHLHRSPSLGARKRLSVNSEFDGKSKGELQCSCSAAVGRWVGRGRGRGGWG